MRPSIRLDNNPQSDAQHGNGQYFTDLTPRKAENFTRAQVSQALYKLPRKWGLTGKLQQIAFIEFEFDTGIKRVQDLFPSEVARQHPDLGIYLYPNTNILSNTAITSSGLVTFQLMASGNR